jgi:hypothetical protein
MDTNITSSISSKKRQQGIFRGLIATAVTVVIVSAVAITMTTLVIAKRSPIRVLEKRDSLDDPREYCRTDGGDNRLWLG